MNENITDIYSKDVIKHWGIKGMKWGVRKDATPTSDAYKEYVSLRKRPFSSLTKTEMEQVKSYAKLETAHKSVAIVPQSTKIKNAVKKEVEKMVIDAVKKQATNQVDKLVKQSFDQIETEIKKNK